MKSKYYIRIASLLMSSLILCQSFSSVVVYAKESIFFNAQAQFIQKSEISFAVGESFYFVNGEKKELSATMGQPFIDENGSTMLPLMATAQMIGETGIHAKWDSISKTATLYYEDFLENPEIEITTGKKEIWSRRHGNVEMNTKAVIVNDRVYVPLRAVLNALGIENDKIKWDSEKKEIQIDRTLSLDTNKITILKENTDTKKWEEVVVEENTKIKKIQSFFSEKEILESTENKISEKCTQFVDFHNGTIIGVSLKENKGYIGNGIHSQGNILFPDGFSSYINELFSQNSENKNEVNQAVLEYKLDDNDYGGIYIEDTVFCIMTINKEKVKTVIEQLGIEDRVRYEDADYSKKQLTNAYNEIWEKREELNLYSARIDIPNNQVIVNTEKVSEQLLDFIASIDDSKCITIVERPKN